MGAALAVFAVVLSGSRAYGAGAERSAAAQSKATVSEEPAVCPGSAPEPTQSATWPVAFCNRTGHDLVLEFHDNDCPAKDWSRRGDVYQRMLRNGESQSFPLCYASEPAEKKLAPGVPTLRIPGGKGVVTTWSVVGDCGERSRSLNLDARTFYDRGEYKTGIVLLQHPAGAAHCMPDVGGTSVAAPPAGAAVGSSAPAAVSEGARPLAPVAPHSPIAAPPAALAATSPSVNTRGSSTPVLSAVVDPKDVVARTVRVFAKDGAGYKCTFNLALTFTDGGSWNDRGSVTINAGDGDAPIATRKYLKSVSEVQLTSSKCAPQ